MNINLIGYCFIGLLIIICIKIYKDSESLHLTCGISDVDGRKYCGRDRKHLTLAADRLANVNVKMNKLVKHCNSKYPSNENVKRMYNGYNPKKIHETLPTSEYTAYSQNKGEKIAFCLNKEKTSDNLIDPNTLTFVAIHELAHIATKGYGHTDEFWENCKFLLGEAGDIGIYEQTDYSKNPVRYCGTDVSDNPYFDK